jgi:N-acetylglutamate synthase-like GNAT family acetyltransferase
MIRRARESDAQAVTALLSQLDYPFEAEAVVRALAEIVADPAHLPLVAEEDGEVVGFVNANFRPQLHHLAPVGTIDELVVDASRRSRRIGEQLVEAVLAEARRRGADVVEVMTHERRERARAFYCRCGFEATSIKLVHPLGAGGVAAARDRPR